MNNLIATILGIFTLCPQLASSFYIINGTNAMEGEFPHQVFIFGLHTINHERSVMLCGGTIIHKNFVLTAAHCVVKIPDSDIIHENPEINSLKTEDIRVGAGSIYLSDVVEKVEKVIIHDKFKFIVFENNLLVKYDIALLKIAENGFDFSNPNVKSLDLLNEIIPLGAELTIIGWGKTSNEESQSINEATPLKVLDNARYTSAEECKINAGSAYYKGMFCLKSLKSYGVCHGDSGGPAIYKGKLAGIASQLPIFNRKSTTYFDCGTGYSDVFTKVSYFVGWINESIAKYV